MQLNTNLSQKQELKLIIAPRMIQSMEILQLPVMALQERIEHELQENPVLELKEGGTETEEAETTDKEAETPAEPEVAPAEEYDPANDPQQELVIDEKGGNEEDFDRLAALTEDWAEHFNEETRPSSNRVDEETDRKHDAMANMVARPHSLQDYLNDQVGYIEIDSTKLELVRYLISHIDDRGYLGYYDDSVHGYVSYTLEELAEGLGGAVSVEQLAEALTFVQQLDPPGVGAREYKECLLLQLTPETPYRDVVRALIQNHLEDIQHNRLPIIQKKTGFDLKAIQEAIEVLKHLNPKPGARFHSDNIPYVIPDILVDRTEEGDYEVKLVDDWTPNIYISRRYFDMLRDKHSDEKAREFLQRKIQSAKWLIDAIEQRRSTLIKVTRAIIHHQKAFLDKGPEHIEPLKMQQIADQVGVHVTTVSRAVDDKWVQTPRGIFPLKRFFGGGTRTESGEEVAWETIKQKLMEIVGNEDKSNPLSDEDLVNKLAEAGYPVARRTVTKYRKMLNIQSSRQRKVWSE
jgi:RNA polymerase sigma-54 factor